MTSTIYGLGPSDGGRELTKIRLRAYLGENQRPHVKPGKRRFDEKIMMVILMTLFVTGLPCHGAEDMIYGCYRMKEGQFRVVENAGECQPREILISWNRVASQEPQGPPGEQGPPIALASCGICPNEDPTTKTTLLFSFVTNQVGFDTGIALSNTGSEMFGIAGQAGTCILRFYGANAPANVVTSVVPPGATYTVLASSSAPNFQGYMIASCHFPFAQGFAFISNLAAQNLSRTYRPLIIYSADTPTP